MRRSKRFESKENNEKQDKINKEKRKEHSNIKGKQKCVDSNSYKDLNFQSLLKLESLGKGGFGEVAVYYDHNLQQALAVKQFQCEKIYLEEKERNTNCDFLQDRNRYFASMLSYSDSKHMIFYELGDCTLLEINNHFIQQNYLSTQKQFSSGFNSEDNASVQKQNSNNSVDKCKNEINITKRNLSNEHQKWREIDLIYITYSLLNGVFYMRQNKMFHGDISPDNIMIFQNRLKFIDLGSSHFNNNNLYLKQYKRQFVNLNIMRPNKHYSDDEITQNELYALGRTITHLCLYINEEREDLIINKNLTLNSLKSKFEKFKEIMLNSKSLKDYPKLRILLLKMQYPFDEDIECLFQQMKQQNKEIYDDKKVIIAQEKESPNPNDNISSEESNPNRRRSKRLSKFIQENILKQIKNNIKDKNKQKKNEQISPINSKRVISNLKEENNQKGGKKGKEDKNIEGDEDEEQIKNNINCKKKVKKDESLTIQQSMQIGKTDMITTIMFTEDQNQEEIEKKQQDSNCLKKEKQQRNINDIMIQCLDQLQYILEQYTMKSNIKIFPQFKKYPPYDFEVYSFIFEKSENIQNTCQQIRAQRLEKLLQNHPNPNKELSYLMQLDEKNWRREAAFQVIIDQLSGLCSSPQILKDEISQKVMNIILHQQKLIILRQKTYNIECSDFIDEIIAVCIQHELHIVQLECNFTYCLIWFFQECQVDFEHFYNCFDVQHQKLNSEIEDINQINKFKLLEKLKQNFVGLDRDQPINEIYQNILNQINQIKTK